MIITYLEGFEQFMTDYSREASVREIKHRFTGQKEVMSILSKSYCYLVNEYGLIDKFGTIDLISGQFEYTAGTGGSNLPRDLLYISSVKLNDADNTPIHKSSHERIPTVPGTHTEGQGRLAGFPKLYTVAGTGTGTKLIIDSLPDKNYSDDNTYRLLIYYKQKIIRYTGITSSLVNSSFSDLNFATANTWGGSFKTDYEWDDLIVMGAVAMALGPKGNDMLRTFYGMSKDKAGNKPKYVDTRPRYRLGVSK